MFPLRSILALSLGTLWASGCLFTDVINEAPIPGIRALDSGPYRVGDTIRFDATKSADDSNQGLLADWSARRCVEGRLPQACIEVSSQLDQDLGQTFEVTIENHETLEIQLRVIDSLGAARQQPDLFTVEVSNQEPSLDLQVTGYNEASGPYVLSRDVHFLTKPADPEATEIDPDGDPLEISWQLLPPATSSATDRRFEPFGDAGYVLTPDVSGEWGVIATADDGYGGVDEIRKDFIVAVDGPPCLVGMDPAPVDDAYYVVDSADGARRFSVLSVSDALDAFPASVDMDPVLGQSTFRWYLQASGGGAFVEIPGETASSFLVDPAVHAPGDRLALRVEVSDRVVGPERQLPCSDETWSCALDTGSNCLQRRTWGVDIR